MKIPAAKICFCILLIVGFELLSSAQANRVFAFTGNNSSGCPGDVTPAQGRDGELYGTTTGDCHILSAGSVFHIGTNGSSGVLFQFDNTGEQNPPSGLRLATDGNFYGVFDSGGGFDLGVIYRITPDGIYTVLYNFQGQADGANPYLPLIQASDGSLYGVTGGYYGTLFKYSSINSITPVFSLNSDGSQGMQFSAPPLQGSDGNFYLTTWIGGAHDCGTILKIGVSGTVLHQYDFKCTYNGSSPNGLFQASDGNYYGTTGLGGIDTTGCELGCGTIFQMTPNGTVTLLHKFENNLTHDGAYPSGGLMEGTDGNLYGTAISGGYKSYGTVYKITKTGSFTTLWGFSASDPSGYSPDSGVTQHTNGMFYGTTPFGAAHFEGAIYSLDMSLGPFVSLVQPTGKAGGEAQLLGQGLTGVSSVTFNGVPATTFFVNADTSMTAVVPSGATTGPVVVITPSGVLTSNTNFRVSQ